MQHLAVIGAGITGVTTAYSLLNRGYRVTVYDRDRYAAMQTSFANGGQLSVSNAEVWTQVSTVLKGIKWMFRRDAPLLVNPRPDWHKLSWMAEFVGNIPNYEANTVKTVRLALAAREHLHAWAERENIAFDHETRGIMHLYADAKGLAHAARVDRLLAAGGLEREALTPERMRELEPALVGRFVGGYLTPSDSTGDIHKYTRALADACARRGAEFRYDSEVLSLAHETHGAEPGVRVRYRRGGSGVLSVSTAGETAGLDVEEARYDAIVVCAGTHSRRFAAMLGDRVNVYPVKGYSITVALPDQSSRAAAPWVSLLDDDAKIVTSRLGEDRLRIAGTAEFNGANRDIRSDRVEPLIAWCRRHFPGIDTEHVVPWAGLRPMMPDMLPRVGAGKCAGVFYNTGHGHLGWTLAAATAELVGDCVAGALPNAATSVPGGVGPVRRASGQTTRSATFAGRSAARSEGGRRAPFR